MFFYLYFNQLLFSKSFRFNSSLSPVIKLAAWIADGSVWDSRTP